MNDICNIELDPETRDKIKNQEAICIREYERSDGSRFAKVIDWGELDEMQDKANTVEMMVVPTGLSVIGDQAVKLAELNLE